MRGLIVAAVLAALAAPLGGCVSTLDSMWDDNARASCERENDIPSRQACQDRADQISRDR